MRSLRLHRNVFVILLVLLTIIPASGQDNSPQIDATLRDTILVDRDRDGRLDAGDTLGYTLEITNCGTTQAENVQVNGQVDPNTRFAADSVQVSAPQPATNCPPQNTVGSPPATSPTNTPVPTPEVTPEITPEITPEVTPDPGSPPVVQTTAPANGATEVAVNTNITIQFDQAVTATGDWFAIVCGVSGTFNISSSNVTPTTGDGISYALDPSVDLQVGETCTVTVFAANVTSIGGTPMTADYVFSFTTETPPTVTATNPANGATGVANSTDIVITFDEPVLVTAASFTLECPDGSAFAGGFAVSGSGTNTVTINPTGNLPAGVTCQVVVVAALLSDLDANDPPDLLDGNADNIEGDDYTFSFTTEVDAAPFVQSITPADGAAGVPTDTNIEIIFSELVDISSAADFSLECGGMPQGYTVITPATLPAATTTVIIDPAGNLPDASACTVQVFTSVTDSDSDDPPDNLAATFTATFITEAPPSVTSTNPANGATDVSTGSNIVIDFDEPVDVTTSSFSIECPFGGTTFTYSITGSGTSSITLDPNTNLSANQICTVTAFAAQVSDSDLVDPPQNMTADYVFSFNTVADTAPVASSPLDGATGVATASNIVINFNEPVDVTAGAFEVECLGSPIAFTTIPALPTSNQTSITIDPSSLLPAGSSCSVTVFAANVTDTDTDEPPNNMAGDYGFTFNTIVDLAPAVDQPNIAPASTSTGANAASLNNPVSTTPTLTIPFTEAVDAASGAFTLSCNAAPVTINVSPALPATGAASYDITPAAALTEGANCVLNVVATNITDSDGDDPPDLMANSFSLSFSVDTAPAEILTETEVGGVFQDVTAAGASNVDLDSNIQITFNEPVSVTFPANGLQCPAGNNIPVTVTTNNAATIVLNPDVNLPLNTACVLNIPAANISDVDAGDPPDNPLAGISHTFTTADDDAPTVTTNPSAGGSNVAVNTNITVIFNESVTLTGAWFDLTCSVSGSRTSTGELTGTGLVIIENTPDLVYTIDPSANLAPGDVCTITIDSANVVDNDTIDPPNELDGDASGDVTDGDADDYVAVFSTADLPPQVLNTTPAASATNVPIGQVVTLNFTEAVDVAAGAFTFECPAGTPLSSGFTTSVPLPATAITTINLTPTDPLPYGEVCTLTIDSSLVVDSDPVDPPNFLDGDSSGDLIDDADNFVMTFTVQPLQAIDDAYTVTPHLTYNSGAAGLSVRDNDDLTTVTITGFGSSAGTANGTVPNGTNFITAGGAGGRVVLNADGTFVFYPDAGDTAASGTAIFFYTITGGDTAQVTLQFEAEELVWFVDISLPGSEVCTTTNSGTQACPSSDLVAVAAAHTDNDTIFVATASYTCGITLNTGAQLIGDGSTSNLQTLSGVSPVAGSNFNPYATFSGIDPNLTSSAADCITLATGNTIRGVTIGNTGNFAGIVGTNYGTATISESTINGTGQILNLDTGTVNATFDSLSSSSSDNSFASLRVANSTVNFTSTGGVNISGTPAGVESILLIQNSGTGFSLGSTTVSKASAGRGVVLGNGIVQSAPVTFASLAITTGAGTALETNRQTGTVTVTSNSGAISATGGAAVNVINSVGNTTPLALNLGALTANNSSLATTCLSGTSPAGFCVSGGTGTATASSLTVTTGTNRYGIRINNSSASVTFATVNISGMTSTSAEVDAGGDGYPDNTTSDGDGVFLSSNTGSFTINGGSISNTTGSGADNVDIRSSSNIVINNTTLSNAGKSNVQAINMTGTGSFNSGAVSGAGSANPADAFYFRANAGTLTLFDIDNTNCTMSVAINAEDCVEYIAEGTHTGTLDIDGDGLGGLGNFQSNSNVVEAFALGSATLTLNMNDVQASPVGTGLGGMVLASANNATLIFRVQDNIFSSAGNGLAEVADGIIRIIPQDTGSTVRGRFERNSIDTAAGTGRQAVRVVPLNTLSNFELYINGNTLEASGSQPAILFRTDGTIPDAPALSNAHVFIQNNTITSQGTTANARGIEIQIRDQAGSNNVRFNISGNNINTTAGSSANAIRIRMQQNAINTHATVSNNTLNSGAGVEFIADVANAANNFCLTLSGHTSGEFNLSQSAGTFNFFNGGNAGATISQSGTITVAGAPCTLPVSSGLVYQNGEGDTLASAPLPADTTASVLDVLAEALQLGDQAAYAQSGSFNIPLGPINVGTIPAGSSVTVTFAVPVNAAIPAGTSEVTLQAIISGSNFGSVPSDDPDTAPKRDTTLTPLDSLQAVQTLPQTGEAPWWQDVVIWGVRLGVLALVLLGLTAVRRRFFRAR